MKLGNKIADFVLFIVFWIVFYIDINFCIELDLSKTWHGIVVFMCSLIGVSALYIGVAFFVHYLLKKFINKK